MKLATLTILLTVSASAFAANLQFVNQKTLSRVLGATFSGDQVHLVAHDKSSCLIPIDFLKMSGIDPVGLMQLAVGENAAVIACYGSIVDPSKKPFTVLADKHPTIYMQSER